MKWFYFSSPNMTFQHALSTLHPLLLVIEPIASQGLSGIQKMQSGQMKTWYVTHFRAHVTPSLPLRAMQAEGPKEKRGPGWVFSLTFCFLHG